MTGSPIPNEPDPVVARHARSTAPGALPDAVLGEKVDNLAGMLKELKELRTGQDTLATGQDTLVTEQSRAWTAIKGGLGLVVFDIALSILAGVVLFGLHATQVQTQSLVTQVQAQQVQQETSVHETCSLYSLFLGSYSAKGRAASALGPEGYDKAFRGLETSADHLRCGIPHIPVLG